MKKNHSILDPMFRYRPSFATDLRKTFERIRREQQPHKRQTAAANPDGTDDTIGSRHDAQAA